MKNIDSLSSSFWGEKKTSILKLLVRFKDKTFYFFLNIHSPKQKKCNITNNDLL